MSHAFYYTNIIATLLGGVQVSESDAMDVVDLLHESLLDAVTLDTGQIDFGRKGGMSMAKQVRHIYIYRNHWHPQCPLN